MRLLIALDIDDAIRERIARFEQGISGFAPDARWQKPESLHVTLKFIGEQPEPAVENIKQALSTIDAGPTEIQFRGHGFFPTSKSARVFWVGIESGPQLAALPPPEFGTMTAREFFLYQSQLSPKGSKYTKQARFDLK